MKNLKGKQILLIGLMTLVVVAGYYRWTQNNADEAVTVNSDMLPADAQATSAAEQTDSGYFTTARRERNSARDKSIEIWNDIVQKNDSTNAAKSEAENKISMTAGYIEAENTIESLIRAKGYQDCVVFVDENGVNAVVKSEGLQSNDVAQIKDIIVNQTGVSAINIKISSKK